MRPESCVLELRWCGRVSKIRQTKKMSPSRCFVSLAAALIAGLILPFVISIPYTTGFWLLLCAAIVCIISRRIPQMVFAGLFLCAISLGLIRASYDVLVDATAMRNAAIGMSSRIDLVIEEVQQKDDYQRIIGYSGGIQGHILISAPLYPRIAEGERIRVTCELRSRAEQKTFFQSYLRSRGVVAICGSP